MKFAFSEKEEGDLLVVPYWDGPKEASSFKAQALVLKDFHGKEGETLLIYEEGRRVLLLGLGKQDKATVDVMRKVYASAMKAATAKKIKNIDLLFPVCKQKDKFFQGIAEGLFLSNYSFTYKHDALKEKPVVLLEKVNFIGLPRPKIVEWIETMADGVTFVRDLVNLNADIKVPKVLAKAAENIHPKVKVTVFDQKKLEAMGMGLILAVGRASRHDSCLIQAEYKGNPKSKENIVLIGKGITYDTGGLSLKPTDGMLTMKCDMAGGATVLGAIKTAAALGLKVNVTALVPSAENAIGSDSFKLGDVYTSYSGKTVEINNTDAEGRLVLADAISYANDKLNPSCIVDLATLTGACVVALGSEIAGLFSNDDQLAASLMEASENTDELLCRLPVHKSYREFLNSDIADIQNSGGREAGSITAALFLQEFVGKTPWAHLDIAGPAFFNKPKGYQPGKATGFAMRLLVDFLTERSDA